MNADELRRTYNELRETLTGVGLTWVVHQVEETIQAGRAVEKETRILRDESGDDRSGMFVEQPASFRRPGRPTLMMTLESWPEASQLLFLIDGLRHAIVHAAAVENEQLRLLRTFDRIESVHFESEVEGRDPRLLILTGQADEGERIKSIGKLLDALEREVRQ
jgi:hypothetical protein